MAITRKKSCFAIDRISNLPCDVINNILKYLPLCDAVRTSVLSRVWRCKWLNVPHLVFDGKFGQKLLGKYNIESIIYQILLLHKGAIVEFTLEFADDFCHAINHWLHFLSNHHIEKLKFRFSSLHINRAMPYHLFTFDQLRRLHLTNAHLKPPPVFKGFGRLVNLYLVNVHMAPGDLRRFISKCPMLEHLHLCIYHQIERGDVEIDAPNLKSFCFQGILRSICIENTSLIEEIGITLDEESAVEAFQELEGNLIEFFGRVSSIKRLRLNGGFLQLLSKGEVPQKLSNGLSHLTFLQLSHLDFPSKAELSCALCLIRSSPNLRSLHIIRPIIMDIHDVLAAPSYLKEQKKIGLTFSQLEYVKIDGFSGIEPELRFVKLILSAAIRLRKLEIMCDYEVESAKGSDILTKLARFRRASPRAKIIFK